MSRFRNIIYATHDEHPLAAEEPPRLLDTPEKEIQTPPGIEGEILERFVRARDALLQAASTRGAKTCGVTSSRDREGKTTVSIYLALSLARARPGNVLLVDANLRQPAIHSVLDIPKEPGLVDLIRGDLPPHRVTTRMEHVPLCVVPSGTACRSPSDLFSTEGFGEVMKEMKNLFDTIIVDMPSTKPFPDVEVIGGHLDGVILVVEADKTQLPLIREAKTRIENANLPLFGVTMNRMKPVLPAFINKHIGLE